MKKSLLFLIFVLQVSISCTKEDYLQEYENAFIIELGRGMAGSAHHVQQGGEQVVAVEAVVLGVLAALAAVHQAAEKAEEKVR